MVPLHPSEKGQSLSYINNTLVLMSESFHQGKGAFFSLPDRRARLRQLLFQGKFRIMVSSRFLLFGLFYPYYTFFLFISAVVCTNLICLQGASHEKDYILPARPAAAFLLRSRGGRHQRRLRDAAVKPMPFSSGDRSVRFPVSFRAVCKKRLPPCGADCHAQTGGVFLNCRKNVDKL